MVIVAGTSSEKVLEILKHLPLRLRNKVEEITLDMAGSMNLITRVRLLTD